MSNGTEPRQVTLTGVAVAGCRLQQAFTGDRLHGACACAEVEGRGTAAAGRAEACCVRQRVQLTSMPVMLVILCLAHPVLPEGDRLGREQQAQVRQTGRAVSQALRCSVQCRGYPR